MPVKRERPYRILALSWRAWLAAKLGFVLGLPWYLVVLIETFARALPRTRSRLWPSLHLTEQCI